MSVFFLFRHFAQAHGLDAAPKQLAAQRPEGEAPQMFPGVIDDFPDLFDIAIQNLRNLAAYTTFTEPEDYSSRPDLQEQRAELEEGMDCRVEITVFEEWNFTNYLIGGAVSAITLTVIPIYYDTKITMTTEVYDRSDTLLRSYERSAELRDWVQLFMAFVYPFHPRARVQEEIYLEFLQDTFLEMDYDRVLAGGRGS